MLYLCIFIGMYFTCNTVLYYILLYYILRSITVIQYLYVRGNDHYNKSN